MPAMVIMRRVGLPVMLALLLIGAPGYAQESLPVSTVNGEPIAPEAFQARVRFVRWEYLQELEKAYELTGGNLSLLSDYTLNLVAWLENPELLGEAVLAQMEEEVLLWQTGADLGIAPTAEDAQEREAEFFSLWTDVAPENLPESEEAQAFIEQWYAEATTVSGLSADDIRHIFATEALRGVLLDFLAARLPTEEEAVHLRQILCGFHPENVFDLTPPTDEQRAAAETCIQQAQARLANGDDFAAVASDLSTDRYSSGTGAEIGSATQGGDQGWLLISYLPPALAEAVTSAEPNVVLGPIETEAGLHLVEVLERRMQALTEEQFEESKQGYFDLWLISLRNEADIQRRDDWAAAVPADPGLDALPAEIVAAIEGIRSE